MTEGHINKRWFEVSYKKKTERTRTRPATNRNPSFQKVIFSRNPSLDNENGEGESSGSLSMTIIADPDLLNCPICVETLRSPIYQCENGHIACASCTAVLKNKCSSCRLPIGNFRCRAVEKIIESVRVNCRYKVHGCTEMLSFNTKDAHEKACSYTPCSCPCIGCDFVGASKHLYDHFPLNHKDSFQEFDLHAWSPISISMKSADKYVILRERKEGKLFVLNRCIETLGSMFNVVYVAPPSSEKMWYDLAAEKGYDLIKLRSSVEMMTKWTAQDQPAQMRLLVPNYFITTNQRLSLELCIWKNTYPYCLF